MVARNQGAEERVVMAEGAEQRRKAASLIAEWDAPRPEPLAERQLVANWLQPYQHISCRTTRAE